MEEPVPRPAVHRHLALGWWSLFLFLSLGTALELLHAFKHPMLLDVSNETRRLMWRLAHAHGSLFGLVHLGLAATLRALPALPRAAAISRLVTAAGLLLPLGFFLGGLVVYDGDPWIGVLLAPLGAAAALLATLLTALGVSSLRRRSDA